jgi:SAM-dependent methyltransferase
MPSPPIDFPDHYPCPACGARHALRPHVSSLDVNGEMAAIGICSACLVLVNIPVLVAHHDGHLSNLENQAAALETYYRVDASDTAALEGTVAANGFLINLLKDKLGDLSAKTYLDIGYGAGYSLYAATRHAGHVMGVDLADTSIASLCNALGWPPNLELQGDLAALSRPADIVVLWHTLEHIPNCPDFIAALKARMAPGAHILLQVPLLRPSSIIDVHFSFFGLASLRALFSGQGFDEVDYWFDVENDFVTYMARAAIG